jgi:DNA-binding MarR family transcriptional regulator
VGFLLHDVARLLRKRFEQHARDSGLTRSQWQVLAYLDQNAGIQQGALAELMDVEPITVGRILDKLERLGLAERRPHATDRRIWQLYLTGKAKPKLIEMRALAEVTRGEAFGAIQPAERERLLATLGQMKANLTAACQTPVAERRVRNG